MLRIIMVLSYSHNNKEDEHSLKTSDFSDSHLNWNEFSLRV